MSEIINNREYRQNTLKELIMELHRGKSVDEVKERFEKLIDGVSASEISQMEQALIMEGMPVEEVQRLCDVHAAVFKGSIEDIHKPQAAHEMPGHPIHTFNLENRAIERLIDGTIVPSLDILKARDTTGARERMKEQLTKLLEIDKHYSRKENLVFPFLEKYEITGPPKVMWGVDDEIRRDIKRVISLLDDAGRSGQEIADSAEQALNKVKEMIFKEENILFPMTLEILTEDEWLHIAEESNEIGYCLVKPAGVWKPVRADTAQTAEASDAAQSGFIRFETGVMTPKELEAMLNVLPVDITFIDKDDIVKYFSQGRDRIFPRPKTVIGRTVQNCHPPASVQIVEKMLEDFKSGKKDYEDFWIKKGNMYVYIRYFAVRGKDGEYLGTLEFTQDISAIQRITGEKRLVTQ